MARKWTSKRYANAVPRPQENPLPRTAYARVRLNGIIGPANSPYEIFSYGWNIGLASAFTQNTQDQMVLAASDYHTNAATGIANLCRLREVAMSFVDPLNKQVGDTIRRVVDIPGGGPAAKYPPQISLRVSLGSGSRGRSNRGGFYLPLPGLVVDQNTGLISEADAQGVADATVGLVNRVNTILTTNDSPGSFFSIVGKNGDVPVRVVRVGRALDTIRTRRNALNETYVTSALPITGA